jgi:hypothetical protein
MKKDFFNREFQIGNYFVSASRYSSSMWMKVNCVVSVRKNKPVVRTAEREWNDKIRASERRAVLECPERAVIIRKEDVPMEFAEAIDLVEEAFAIKVIKNGLKVSEEGLHGDRNLESISPK